jgi:cytochrome c peroxidase
MLERRCLIAFICLSLLFSCDEKRGINFPDYFPQKNRIYLDSVRPETILLGEKLFFDPRLSINNKISCASCHLPELAFTDGKKISQGVHGRFSRHNSSTLLNVGFLHSFMYDKGSHNIEIQPIIPLLDTNEMGTSFIELENKFKNDKVYQSLSMNVYGRPLNRRTITWALAAYMKSLIACTSRFDSFCRTKDSSVFSREELRGMNLFYGKGKCNKCHTSPLFTDSEHYNLGLEDSIKGRLGVFANTLIRIDRGRFKTPTLRNIEVTSPYFHDGRISNLEETIKYHQLNERSTYDFVPISLSDQEVKCLASFLKTLTDVRFKK